MVTRMQQHLRISAPVSNGFNFPMENTEDTRRKRLREIVNRRFGGFHGQLADTIKRPRPNILKCCLENAHLAKPWPATSSASTTSRCRCRSMSRAYPAQPPPSGFFRHFLPVDRARHRAGFLLGEKLPLAVLTNSTIVGNLHPSQQTTKPQTSNDGACRQGWQGQNTGPSLAAVE